MEKNASSAPKTIWAYAYEIVPPQPEDRLRAIKALLDDEHSAARRAARTWAGSVVLEQQMTHILVVSDSPEQNHEVNARLEAELKELKAGFSLTAPMAVDDPAPVVPPFSSVQAIPATPGPA